MLKLRFLWTLAVLMMTTVSFAQDEAETPMDIQARVAQINEQCPISIVEGWSVQSCISTGDTVNLVIQTPANLASFLPMLTGNEKNVKRLWIKQLTDYGEQWNQLVDMLVKSDIILILTLRPEEHDTEAVIVLDPADFNKE